MTSVERAAPAVGSKPRPGPRRADRRTGVAQLLAALAGHVRAGHDALALRLEFEARLRDILKAQTVRLREETATYGPGEAGGDSRRLSFEVPTRRQHGRVLLEAQCGSAALDAWSLQVLGMAAHLAALVVDVGQRALPVAPVGRLPLIPTTPPLVGGSAVMHGLRDRICRVAATDFTVLIQGESGTGKELVARQVHALSRRGNGPFVAVNCAAIVDTLLEAELFGIEERTATGVRGRRGKFEHADGGTLFLDEVADLTPAAQAKLLRAIQELSVERVGGHTAHRVDARIVVATNRGLSELVARGLFREDLYYRLSGVELQVPPLRIRREDIRPLAAHFLLRHAPARSLALSPDAEQALVTYAWPGNVRELERTLEGAVTSARGDVIALEDLPASVRHDFTQVVWPSLAGSETMRAWGCRYARLVLQRCDGNKRRACDVLGISYHTLQSYLREKLWDEGEGGDEARDDVEKVAALPGPCSAPAVPVATSTEVGAAAT
jgi:transcriptional regulator with AAA-type ATPase domain